MDWVFSLSLYTIICLISYEIIRYQYMLYTKRGGLKKNNRKLYLFSMIFISGLYTYYNWYITNLHGSLTKDRLNYQAEFLGYRSCGSIGLQCIFDIVHDFNGNIYVVFYITTFICIFITLLAYCCFENADYKMWLLLMTSEWFFYTVGLLKQCYAIAFAALFFSYIFKQSNKKNNIIIILCAILAFLFHVSGAILFPVYIMVRGKNLKNRKTKLLLLSVVLGIIFFKPILILSATILRDITPILSNKIIQYMVDESTGSNGSVLSVIKWIQLYYITFIGLLYRKYLSNKIADYNKYLVVAFISSGLVLLSMFSYWFNRFRPMFCIPVFVLFILINKNIKTVTSRYINSFIVYGSGIIVFVRWFVLNYIKYGGF